MQAAATVGYDSKKNQICLSAGPDSDGGWEVSVRAALVGVNMESWSDVGAATVSGGTGVMRASFETDNDKLSDYRLRNDAAPASK